jgi:hypothetical protein
LEGFIAFRPRQLSNENASHWIRPHARIFVILPANAVWVAEMDDRIAGFIAFAEGWVNHLYATLRHAVFRETVSRSPHESRRDCLSGGQYDLVR